MNMDDKTIVYMTPEQVALFILFQKHYDSISYLISQEVFELKDSNAVIHFDHDGYIKSLKKESFFHRNAFNNLHRDIDR